MRTFVVARITHTVTRRRGQGRRHERLRVRRCYKRRRRGQPRSLVLFAEVGDHAEGRESGRRRRCRFVALRGILQNKRKHCNTRTTLQMHDICGSPVTKLCSLKNDWKIGPNHVVSRSHHHPTSGGFPCKPSSNARTADSLRTAIVR